MKRESRFFTVEAVVGGVAVLMCVLLVVMFSAHSSRVMKGVGDCYGIYAAFQNAGNLIPGSQVRVAGVVSGRVEKVELLEGGQGVSSMCVDSRVALPWPLGPRSALRLL